MQELQGWTSASQCSTSICSQITSPLCCKAAWFWSILYSQRSSVRLPARNGGAAYSERPEEGILAICLGRATLFLTTMASLFKEKTLFQCFTSYVSSLLFKYTSTVAFEGRSVWACSIIQSSYYLRCWHCMINWSTSILRNWGAEWINPSGELDPTWIYDILQVWKRVFLPTLHKREHTVDRHLTEASVLILLKCMQARQLVTAFIVLKPLLQR